MGALMSDGERNALITPLTQALDQPGLGAQKVLSRVISDALLIAEQRSVTESYIPFEGYQFREQDYRQLLRWADAAQMTPNKFINELRLAKNVFWDGTTFLVEDGAITQVVFTPNLLTSPLDLSDVPNLKRLKCDYNNLQYLDLTNVKNLRELYCEGNKLSKIDLSNVTKLEILCCGNNNLSYIDLSTVPELITLSCGRNKIQALFLPRKLLKLSCMRTEIQKLDLRAAPRIDYLACDSRVDLGPADKVSELIRYNCLQRS